jgi:hypothetical protein
MEFEEIDDMPERFEDDLEEFERNQVAHDIELERRDEEAPLGEPIDDGGLLQE